MSQGIKWDPRKWHPLYFVSVGFAISLLVIAFIISQLEPTPYSLIYLASGVCVSAFAVTALASKLRSTKSTPPGSVFKSLEEDIEKQEEEWVPDESPAVMLGASGVYGIVYGLGITDAIGAYAERLKTITISLSALPATLSTIVMNLPYTFRLLGFLVTIIPFLHGTVLMFSNRWYYNKLENKYHFGVAFIYLIFAFIHAVLFFFVASNVLEASRYLSVLWVVMFVNTAWLCIQVIITNRMKIKNFFLPPWILINFNTLAFLTIFVLAPPSIFVGQKSIDGDLGLNSIILIVLTARSIVDYYVGWESFYNRLPQKKPEEIMRLSTFLQNKKIITKAESDSLSQLAADKLMRPLG